MQDIGPHLKLRADFLPKTLKLAPSTFRTLLGISLHLDSDNIVDLSAHKRTQVLQMLSISKQTFSNSLGELQRAGIINKLDTGLFAVDSMYIKRGQHDD